MILEGQDLFPWDCGLRGCGEAEEATVSGMAEGEGLRERVLEMMKAPGYQSRTRSEIAKDLGLRTKEKGRLRSVLAELEKEGVVDAGKKARVGLKTEDPDVLVGNLRFHQRESAWFYPELGHAGNLAMGIDLKELDRVYVSSRKVGVALDGDRVAIRLDKLGGAKPKKGGKGSRGGGNDRKRPEDGPTGRVVEIVERRSGVVVGTFMKKGKFSYVVPDDESMPPTIELSAETTANAGQKVAVELVDWERRESTPRGKVVRILGYPDEAGVDILAIIEAHGLRTEFPEDVIAEAQAVPDKIPADEIARRDDWREEFVFTIDPVSAKDFDDAIAVKRVKDGWKLAVHIADVSHYVKPDSPLDKEAVKRGNSTYLVDRVLPMLPPSLSNGICSLRPNEERLTCAAVMEFDKSGKMGKATFLKAVIDSKFRLTYEEAQVFIETGRGPDGKRNPELEEAIEVAWELASVLRKRRFSNGALDLEMADVRVVLGEDGKPTGYKREEYNESHQLIEECMLVANEAVARAIKNAQRPGIYRIHEDPDFDKLNEYAEMAKSHGYEPGDLSNRKHIQKLLDAAKGRPEEHAIKLGLLKSLKRAAYSPEPVGHYGLAKTDYTHFTSPIRRYADLIVHRGLEPLLVNPPEKMDRVPNKAHCVEIADHISTTERKSASAENETKRLKLLQWLKACSESDDPPVFHAVVTEVRSMGLMVEATEVMQRGIVKRESFPPGDWRLEAHRGRFSSRNGSLSQNDILPVIVADVNIERQFVDYQIVEVDDDGKPLNLKQNRPAPRRGSGGSRKKSGGGGRKPAIRSGGSGRKASDGKMPAKKSSGARKSTGAKKTTDGGRRKSPSKKRPRGNR